MNGGIWAAAAALLVAASTAVAQDTVRLRSGKLLSGTIVVEPFDDEGFTITLWDTGGVAYVRWTQVAPSEERRLRDVPVADDGDLIEGVRVVTTSREVVGILTGETEQTLHVKTAGSASPVAIPKRAVLVRRAEQIRESDAWSPHERVDRREKDASTTAQRIDAGRFALGLRLYARALAIFKRAAEAADDHRAEAARLADECAALIREAEAEAALTSIRALQREARYDAAVEAADRWVSDFAETQVGRRHRDLARKLRDERTEFRKNRDRVLAQKVPELWRSVRSGLWSKYADRKYTFAEAHAAVAKLDDEIVAEICRKLGTTPEEAVKYWQQRDPRSVTAGMGSGSWIHLGGQSGGYDHDSGDKRDAHRFRLGRPLDTREDWWSDADTSQRRRWLQCCYALASAMVRRTAEEDRDCTHCKAAGTVRATRGKWTVDVVCPRCHRTKRDRSVTFW